jgi:DNA repair protein RadD
MHVMQTLREMGVQAESVFGDTLTFERDGILGNFRAQRLKYLINVGVLTHGFDAPCVDAVALLRPTLSPGLYYQMVGRGFRLFEGKANCLILDYGGNIMRHGPVDMIGVQNGQRSHNGEAPAKECPECHSVIAAGYMTCPDCGHQFERNASQHEAKASNAGILSGTVTEETHLVQGTTYSIYAKRNASPGAPPTMRVDYQIGFRHWQSEWVCFEHTGFARHKAELWWQRRSNVAPVPTTVEEAADLANGGALCETKSITIRSIAGEKYDRIIGYELEEKPDYREPGWDAVDTTVQDEQVAEPAPF